MVIGIEFFWVLWGTLENYQTWRICWNPIFVANQLLRCPDVWLMLEVKAVLWIIETWPREGCVHSRWLVPKLNCSVLAVAIMSSRKSGKVISSPNVPTVVLWRLSYTLYSWVPYNLLEFSNREQVMLKLLMWATISIVPYKELK